MPKLLKALKKILKIFILVFAIWGFILTVVFLAMKFGLTKSNSLIDKQSEYFKNLLQESQQGRDERSAVAIEHFAYIENLAEWPVIKLGLEKDKEVIQRVSQETDVPARLLVTPLVGEQLRLMTSEREIFKKYFQPLAILGSQTQFSLGIYGIKEGVAKEIERNLKNKESPYYLGEKYENLLDYPPSQETLLVDAWTLEPVKENKNSTTSNSTTSASSQYPDTILLTGSDAQRVKRLISEKDHYYSYLYVALYLKQLETAWARAGFSIQERPEILATLYNIGFENSHPNPNPQVGGAEITLGSQKYTFGAIAYYFYFSNELLDIFPR